MVNISYSITWVGDSQFECTLKPFEVEHSIENLQKILDCLFIKRFIGKNENAIRNYIDNQLKEDRLAEQLTLDKIDPFMGSKK